MVCNKPHANPTIIYENIKEIHTLAVGGNLEFPILSHVLLRRGPVNLSTRFDRSSGKYRSAWHYGYSVLVLVDLSTCLPGLTGQEVNIGMQGIVGISYSLALGV